MTYSELAEQVGKLVEEKNAAYGNSFFTSGEALKLLYPHGVSPEQYGDVLTLVRIWDKMMRIATKKDAFGESPYKDIVGYGLLGASRIEARAVQQPWKALGLSRTTYYRHRRRGLVP